MLAGSCNPTIDFLAKERNRLVEENRELLAALKEALANPDNRNWVIAAKAIILKTEGE